jgi:hypothetical protein
MLSTTIHHWAITAYLLRAFFSRPQSHTAVILWKEEFGCRSPASAVRLPIPVIDQGPHTPHTVTGCRHLGITMPLDQQFCRGSPRHQRTVILTPIRNCAPTLHWQPSTP